MDIVNDKSPNNLNIVPKYKPNTEIMVRVTEDDYIEGTILSAEVINNFVVYRIRKKENGIIFKTTEQFIYTIAPNTVFNDEEEDYGDEG